MVSGQLAMATLSRGRDYMLLEVFAGNFRPKVLLSYLSCSLLEL